MNNEAEADGPASVSVFHLLNSERLERSPEEI